MNQNQTSNPWQKYQTNFYWWRAIDAAFDTDTGLSTTFQWAAWMAWE